MTIYAALLGLGVAIVWLLASAALPLRYPFANDTAGYVEEATNFLAGKSLARVGPWSDPGEELTVSRLFPPGYPLIVVALASTGLAPKWAALAAAWAAWALFLPAVFFAVRPLFRTNSPAVAVAVTAAVSPALYDWGFQALSDGVTVLASVIAVGALVRAAGSTAHGWRWAVAAGVAAGIAYWVRNAAIIFPAVAGGTFALAFLLGALPLRVAATRLVLWACGAGAILLPLFARNLLVFGAVQPYFSGMGGTEYGVVRAFRLMLWSELLDLTGVRVIAQLAWSAPLLAAIGLPLAVLLGALGVRAWRAAVPNQRVAGCSLAIFAGLGFAMVIVGRARFDWVETELTRHAMQYTWAVIALLGAVVLGGVSARAGARAMFVALCAALLAGHGWFIYRDLQREAAIDAALRQSASYAEAAAKLGRPEWILTNQIRRAISRDAALKSYVAGLPPRAHVLSNFSETLSFETGRHVRTFAASEAQLRELARLGPRLPPERRPLVAIAIPNNHVLRSGEATQWQARIVEQAGPGFRVERRTADLLVLVHD